MVVFSALVIVGLSTGAAPGPVAGGVALLVSRGALGGVGGDGCASSLGGRPICGGGEQKGCLTLDVTDDEGDCLLLSSLWYVGDVSFS